MQRNARKQLLEGIETCLIYAILLPTTAIYVFGIPLLFVFAIESPIFFGLLFLAPYGLYAAWNLAFNYKDYFSEDIPLLVFGGVASEVYGVYLLWSFFGFPNHISKYVELEKQFAVFYLYGGAPLTLTIILLALIFAKRHGVVVNKKEP